VSVIKTIKDLIGSKSPPPEENKKIILIDPSELHAPTEPDLRIVGLFGDVNEEKVAELVHGLLVLDEMNKLSDESSQKPIEFYISTYGGSADDMFGLYDIIRLIKETSEVHTIGLGKVMSAGVLLLAAGTKGKRQIGKNCRVMIHSVMGGNHGSLHNMMNELEAIEQLQEMYCDALTLETKMTRAKFKKMIERKVNVYLSAEEAVEMGIADIIV
jgi:ATP-dependent Clp protease protease subunit